MTKGAYKVQPLLPVAAGLVSGRRYATAQEAQREIDLCSTANSRDAEPLFCLGSVPTHSFTAGQQAPSPLPGLLTRP